MNFADQPQLNPQATYAGAIPPAIIDADLANPALLQARLEAGTIHDRMKHLHEADGIRGSDVLAASEYKTAASLAKFIPSIQRNIAPVQAQQIVQLLQPQFAQIQQQLVLVQQQLALTNQTQQQMQQQFALMQQTQQQMQQQLSIIANNSAISSVHALKGVPGVSQPLVGKLIISM